MHTHIHTYTTRTHTHRILWFYESVSRVEQNQLHQISRTTAQRQKRDQITAIVIWLPLTRRNSRKSSDRGNVAPSGIKGPKQGTFFDLDTAMLNEKKQTSLRQRMSTVTKLRQNQLSIWNSFWFLPLFVTKLERSLFKQWPMQLMSSLVNTKLMEISY